MDNNNFNNNENEEYACDYSAQTDTVEPEPVSEQYVAPSLDEDVAEFREENANDMFSGVETDFNYDDSYYYEDEEPEHDRGSDKIATTSMILGIVSIAISTVGFCGCCLRYLPVPAAVLAIVFSCVSKNHGTYRVGQRKTGLICGNIALALFAISLIYSIIMVIADTGASTTGSFIQWLTTI